MTVTKRQTRFETRDLFGQLTAVDVISVGPGGRTTESTQLGLQFEAPARQEQTR